jgi:hypothetical protein
MRCGDYTSEYSLIGLLYGAAVQRPSAEELAVSAETRLHSSTSAAPLRSAHSGTELYSVVLTLASHGEVRKLRSPRYRWNRVPACNTQNRIMQHILDAPCNILDAPCNILDAPCNILDVSCNILDAPCNMQPVTPQPSLSAAGQRYRGRAAVATTSLGCRAAQAQQ